MNRSRREVAEEEQVENLPPAGRALRRDGDLRAVDRRVADDRTVHGGVVGDLLVGCPAGALEHAGVDEAHVATAALVDVLRVAAAAQRLGVLVDHVAARRREHVGEAAPAADQQVTGKRDRRRAAPVQAGRVHVDLVGEPRVEVVDLRTADEERMVGLRVLGVHHQHVGRLVGRPTTRGRCGPRERGRRRPDVAARIDDHVASAAARDRRVGKPAGIGGRLLGVVVLAKVVEDL